MIGQRSDCPWKGLFKLAFTSCVLLVSHPIVGTASDGKSRDDTKPTASFEVPQSTVVEHNGSVLLKVIFSQAFNGRLVYNVDGTGEQGTDFNLPETVVETDGPVSELNIAIKIIDDEIVEDIETVRIALQAGDTYEFGSVFQHTVTIQDNDVSWHIVHDVDGMLFDYGMKITRNGSNTAAIATSNGSGGLPAGSFPVELGVVDGNRFEAKIGPIEVPANQTLLGVDLSRNFTLIAEKSEQGHVVDPESVMRGVATEEWTASEDANHLVQSQPLVGSFWMSRTISNFSPTVVADTEVGTAEQNAIFTPTTCRIDEGVPTNNFTATPSKRTVDGPNLSTIAPSNIPYPDFVVDTLKKARALLYWDSEATQENKNAAAFRYKALLYERERNEQGNADDAEAYIRAQFEEMEHFWTCAEKQRAHQAAQIVIDALQHAPWNQDLRRILLDIYFDIAVAEKALANEQSVAVVELMIRERREGEFVINDEIAALEEALLLYRNAFSGYMNVLQATFGIDVTRYFETEPQPFGYYIFREEVPKRSPYATVFKRANGEWVLPTETSANEEPPLLFEGYKDATLLFELLRDYLRTTEQLAKRYIMRGESPDLDRASELIGTAMQSTYLEGHFLLGMFPDITEQDKKIDSRSGLREAVAGWRHSYTSLLQSRNALAGDTNILGYKENFLALTQSAIPGEGQQDFHSFNFFIRYLESASGPLATAKEDWNTAKLSIDALGMHSDKLAQEFADRTEQYDERLRKIVGVRPGKPGYDSPNSNNGEIGQIISNIERLENSINLDELRIENQIDRINIEVERRGKEAGINNAISQVYIDYGDKQVDLTKAIAEIRERKVKRRQGGRIARFFGGMVKAVVGGAIGFTGAGASVGGGLFVSGASDALGAITGSTEDVTGPERKKGMLQASKERLAAEERARVNSLNDDLLDNNSRALIKNLKLEIGSLELQLIDSEIAMENELKRLSSLYNEKEDLERRKAGTNKRLAERYFADPAHRILKDASLLRSEYSFNTAQRWLFFAIRAAEYKWNQKFDYVSPNGVTYSMHTLLKTRNAKELEYLLSSLKDWDASMIAGARNDDHYKVLSIKGEFFGGDTDGNYFPFKEYILNEKNYLDPADPDNPIPGFKVLRLKFSTAFVPDSGGHFMTNAWNEKINFLRVEIEGGPPANSQGGTVEGYLTYGGVSLIRNQKHGTPNPDETSRIANETTDYSTQFWYFSDNQWRSKGAFGSRIAVRLTDHPKAPESTKRINSFKEFSVAATDWNLYIAVERNGRKLVQLEEVSDIKFHINSYWYVRNRN